jgi:hypothetical protein
MEIEFKPEDIELYVKGALIKSSIGKAMDNALQDVLNIDRYDCPIRRELKVVLEEMIKGLIRDKYYSKILTTCSAIIEKMITDEFIQNSTQLIAENIIKSIKYSYNE